LKKAWVQSPFLKACRLEKAPYTPVWLMRQAGRYMKEYRAIRDRVPFLALCKNPDLVTEVTVNAQEKIGADAAIIFSDILLIVEPLGLKLNYLKGDGPSISAVKTAGDVEALSEADPKKSLSFVYRAIRQTRGALKAGIPLIGFAGAPFTLASYMIEGGSSDSFVKTRKFMRTDGAVWKILMEKITAATILHLEAQIEAGVQAVQLFDSWVGCLSVEEYKKYALPFSKKVIKGLKNQVPVIHFGTNTGHFLEEFACAGSEVVGVDHRIELDDAWKRIGHKKAIQGNLDPRALLKNIKTIKKHVRKILDSVKERPGHIFNLGHGVLPETPVENVIALVEIVHEYKIE